MTKLDDYTSGRGVYVRDEQCGDRRRLAIEGKFTLEDLEKLVRYLREVPYTGPTRTTPVDLALLFAACTRMPSFRAAKKGTDQ